jgi:putative aldouronate transport system permease protein
MRTAATATLRLDERQIRRKDRISRIKSDKYRLILLAPAILVTLVFAYIPLPGILISFFENSRAGALVGDFVGFGNFERIFSMLAFRETVWNTLYLNVLALLVGFPAPIILALLFNELRNKYFKSITQSISFLPHFLSWISVVGIAMSIYSLDGTINAIRSFMFPDSLPVLWLAEEWFFVPNYLILSVWKGLGWGSIIYLAAISAIDQALYEAATIDGANKFQQARHITVPSIMPTAIILLILSMGGMFASNFELVYGLQNAFIRFEVIGTIVFKTGIEQGDFAMGTSIGFLQGLVGLILVFTANMIAKKVGETALW